MSEFLTYLQLGFLHITDLQGYDHILFVIALCVVFEAKDWRKILLLVTAFTVGHSITLLLSTLNIITFNKNIVEILIPITIILTCITNLKVDARPTTVLVQNKYNFYRYPMAVAFGLIHGMGFSSFLKSLLGKDESIVKQLLAFNIGLEIGQIIIVLVTLFVSIILLDGFKFMRNNWIKVSSGIVIGMAFMLLMERLV